MDTVGSLVHFISGFVRLLRRGRFVSNEGVIDRTSLLYGEHYSSVSDELIDVVL